MRIVAVLLVAAAPALFAQRSASPFGRILFPGGNPPAAGVQPAPQPSRGSILFPGTGAPYVPRPTFGGSVWASAPLNPPRPVHDHERQGVIAVPVAVPVYYNSGYYAYEPPPAQYVPVNMMTTAPYPVAPPQQDASPVIIINQYFRGDEPPVTETAAQASVRTAPAVAPVPEPAVTAPSTNDPIFMIAMKDHFVHTARAYWIEDGSLNFITTDGSEKRVAMADVDRDLSRRLNRDRNVAFGLPAN